MLGVRGGRRQTRCRSSRGREAAHHCEGVGTNKRSFTYGGSPLRGDPPPPRHGESNPDPQRACSPGEPSWRVVQKLAAAQEGHSALPTPHKNSAQSEGERRLYQAIAQDGELASRSMPWGWAIAQSRIVRERDE